MTVSITRLTALESCPDPANISTNTLRLNTAVPAVGAAAATSTRCRLPKGSEEHVAVAGDDGGAFTAAEETPPRTLHASLHFLGRRLLPAGLVSVSCCCCALPLFLGQFAFKWPY